MNSDAEYNKSVGQDASNKDRDEALRSLGGANASIESLSSDIVLKGERVLDDLFRQINDFGEQCPEELRAARRDVERTLADARQTLSDASKGIESLRKHLKSK